MQSSVPSCDALAGEDGLAVAMRHCRDAAVALVVRMASARSGLRGNPMQDIIQL
jgi:hypothetical protein